ncbi:MAG: phosphotransferase [bacterium]|nr:phosphotransferase [bacterium]
MFPIPNLQSFAQITHRIAPNASLLRAWPLKGGVSADVTALEIAYPNGDTRKVVVRQHGERDRQGNPHIARDEFRLLQRLYLAGFPVPAPVLLDESGEILSIPYLVIAWIEGVSHEVMLAAHAADDGVRGRAARSLAHFLTALHQLDLAQREVGFLRPHPPSPVLPQGEEAEGETAAQSRAVLEAVWPLTPLNSPVILHGDLWPGNVLWREGEIAAVLDWEDAALGDSLIDVANTRLETRLAFGVHAQDEFTREYAALNPTVNMAQLPYRDLFVALRMLASIGTWGLEAAVEARMRAGVDAFAREAMHVL